jgi:hypothetical protein
VVSDLAGLNKPLLPFDIEVLIELAVCKAQGSKTIAGKMVQMLLGFIE